MRRPIARTLGVLAVAAALTTSHAVALAAPPTSSLPLYATRRATTLIGLSPELRTSAIQKAASRPNAPKLTGQGGTSQQSEKTDAWMNLVCGDDWFIIWEEDENGNPISHTFKLHCGGEEIPIG